jgi:hypothetical protein
VIKSREERPAPGDLGEYAREVVHDVKSPYFARTIEDVLTALTTAMVNVFEDFFLMGHVRDDYTHEGKVSFPQIQSNELSKAIVERDYERNQVASLKRDLGLLKGEIK